MSDILGVSARNNGSALELFDKSTGRTVAVFDAALGPVYAKVFTATLAQINAGTEILAGDANRTIQPVDFWIKCNGSFGALTDIRLSDEATSPVDIATVAQAQATDGAVFTKASSSGLTIGAGFAAPLTAGKGVQIRKTGSTGTTATSVSGILFYQLV